MSPRSRIWCPLCPLASYQIRPPPACPHFKTKISRFIAELASHYHQQPPAVGANWSVWGPTPACRRLDSLKHSDPSFQLTRWRWLGDCHFRSSLWWNVPRTGSQSRTARQLSVRSCRLQTCRGKCRAVTWKTSLNKLFLCFRSNLVKYSISLRTLEKGNHPPSLTWCTRPKSSQTLLSPFYKGSTLWPKMGQTCLDALVSLDFKLPVVDIFLQGLLVIFFGFCANVPLSSNEGRTGLWSVVFAWGWTNSSEIQTQYIFLYKAVHAWQFQIQGSWVTGGSYDPAVRLLSGQTLKNTRQLLLW